MKMIKSLVLVGLLTICAASINMCKAQTDGNWRLLGISTTHDFKGIEGYYQLTTCNNEDVVVIKLVNDNSFNVKAGWSNIAYTTDNKMVHAKSLQDSVIIKAGGTNEGSCTSNKALVVKLSDLGLTKSTLGTFTVSNFDFVTANK